MRSSVIAAAGLVALGAVAALAATSLAGGDDADIVSADRGLHPVAATEVSRDEAAGPAPMRQPRRASQKLSYVQTKPIQIPPHTEEAAEINKCPKGSKAVGGYFATTTDGKFLDLNQPVPDAPRKWRIGVFNSTDVADHAVFGIVCISDVR